MVGVAGLEPATTCTPCKHASQLHHTPNTFKNVFYFTLIAGGQTRICDHPVHSMSGHASQLHHTPISLFKNVFSSFEAAKIIIFWLCQAIFRVSKRYLFFLLNSDSY
jgi:hypothetical protein